MLIIYFCRKCKKHFEGDHKVMNPLCIYCKENDLLDETKEIEDVENGDPFLFEED